MKNIFSGWLSDEKRTAKTVAYALFFLGAWWLNAVIQGFCVPVAWAAIVLIVFLAAFLAYPYFKQKKILSQVLLFVQGTGVLISLYCLIFYFTDSYSEGFLSDWLLFMIAGPFFVPPLILPALMLFILVRRCANGSVRFGRACFVAGALLPLLPVAWASSEYSQIVSAVSKLPEAATVEQAQKMIPRTYAGERFAGLHFRYHTRLCIYDGWRPPLHDPLLVAAMWMNNYNDPLRHRLSLQQRVRLYRNLFPGNDPRGDCGCTPGVYEMYRNDEVFK